MAFRVTFYEWEPGLLEPSRGGNGTKTGLYRWTLAVYRRDHSVESRQGICVSDQYNVTTAFKTCQQNCTL